MRGEPRSRLSLDEEGHVYHLGTSVAALRTLSTDEGERWHPIRVDHRSIVPIEGADLSQGPNTKRGDYLA